MATQIVVSPPSTPVIEPWTIHDSNITLHECLSRRNPPIPNEIILQILDDSSRWIRTKIINAGLANDNELTRVGSHVRNHGQQQILATNQLSSLEVARIRRVVFTFRSQDQGWSGDPLHHGTFNGSWTWFEASLTRFIGTDYSEQERDDLTKIKEEKEKVRYQLQRNRHAGREPENYRHELGIDHALLQQVEEGDSFVLWARARYPAWENRVYKAVIEVWCVDDLEGVLKSTA